jgi:hypothetical protein
MTGIPSLQSLMAAIGLAALAALIWSCDGDGSSGGGDGGTDGDTDTDTDDCEPVSWGALTDFTEGMPVGNWSHTGYFDGDQDGFVEETEVTVSLEDIHCAGYESIVVMVGDTT